MYKYIHPSPLKQLLKFNNNNNNNDVRWASRRAGGAGPTENRLGVLVRGQANTGVVFGFVISKQTAPLCGFEKSNAEQRIRGHQRGSRSVLGDAPSGFSERRRGFWAACVCGGSLVRRQNT